MCGRSRSWVRNRSDHQGVSAGDANLFVYATEHRAALVTLDREFTLRRRRNPIGRHIGLRCTEPEAADLLAARLAEVLEYLERDHVTLVVSKLEVRADSSWG